MKKLLRYMLSLALVIAPSTALSRLDVVATTTDMGLLAREIGGNVVRVAVLAPPDRDPHYLQARPSMIRALRGAELLLSTGAELEAGWLPAALRSAANPAIQPGELGHFEGAAQVSLLNAGETVNRAQGDVHPSGNPHFSLDPVRYAEVGTALAARLGRLDPENAGAFEDRAARFAAAIEQRLPRWRGTLDGAPGVVSFHKDIDYLLQRFEVPALGYLEPVPGVPPTASHLQDLVSRLQDRRGVVIRHPYQPARPAEQLAQRLGWQAKTLPLHPPVEARGADYIALIDAYVEALASAGR